MKYGAKRGRNGAFHVRGAPAVQRSAVDLGGKWRMSPGILISGGDHINMARKANMRRAFADACVKVIYVRCTTLAEGEAMAGEASRRQFLFHIAQGAALIRCNGAAADQVLSVFGSADHVHFATEDKMAGSPFIAGVSMEAFKFMMFCQIFLLGAR